MRFNPVNSVKVISFMYRNKIGAGVFLSNDVKKVNEK